MRAAELGLAAGRREVRRVASMPRGVWDARVRIAPWLRARRELGRYELLTEDQLRARRRSDTVFVFGSGASLSDIASDEWARIAERDTFGFNWFVRQKFVRCDFHLIRGIPDTDLDPDVWRPQLEEYFTAIRENVQFAETAFLVQTGFRATNGNRALGYGYLADRAPVFLWRTDVRRRGPGRSFADGLTHGHSTIQEVVNAAWLLGWKEIVLVGVDLDDRRYFWLPPEETRTVDARRGASADEPHTQSESGLASTSARGPKCSRATACTCSCTTRARCSPGRCRSSIGIRPA